MQRQIVKQTPTPEKNRDQEEIILTEGCQDKSEHAAMVEDPDEEESKERDLPHEADLSRPVGMPSGQLP